MTNSRLDGVLSGPRLPTLPAVAVHVLQLAESPDATLAQIAEAIEFDQGLVVRLLRTVNSSYYGLQRECRGVNQAIGLLGLRAVRSLVLGFSLAKSLDGGGDNDVDFPWRAYWRRSVRVAAAARTIARFSKGVDADEAQVAGLLAEIGMVALFRAFGDRYLQTMDAARRDHASLIAEEKRTFDVQHAEVGRLMAERWQFPAELVAAIGAHEREPSVELSKLELVVALAGLAERAIGEGQASAKANAEVLFLRHAERLLGLSLGQASQVLESISQRGFELAAMLELDVGPEHDAEALVDRAQALREPDAGDGTSGPNDEIQASGFEERLATAFHHAGTTGGLGIAVIEPDGAGSVGLRQRREEVTMARLQATIGELAGKTASVHRLSPTLIVLVIESGSTREGERGTLKIVERIRRDVQARKLQQNDGALLTISVGIAIHGSRRFESPDSLLRAAMLALSAAQRSGCNRVGHFKPSYDPSVT